METGLHSIPFHWNWLFGVCNCHCNYANIDHIKIYVKFIRRSNRIIYRFKFYVSFCSNLHVHFHRFKCHVPKLLYYTCKFFPKKKFTAFSVKWFDIFMFCQMSCNFFDHFTLVHIYEFSFFISYFKNEVKSHHFSYILSLHV